MAFFSIREKFKEQQLCNNEQSSKRSIGGSDEAPAHPAATETELTMPTSCRYVTSLALGR
eukprot:scaffold703_cov133-Skeletonema_dohrnii-CCMP3373.AAC.3